MSAGDEARITLGARREHDGAVLSARVVLFDVNETLSDTTALGGAFAALGAPEHLAPTWFAGVLRDGFALTAAGASAPFADVGAAVARTLLRAHLEPAALDGAVAAVLAAMGELPVHPDVPAGVRALAATGVRLATLTNGGSAVPAAVLGRAGLRDAFEALLSVQDGPGAAWKPAASAYRHAAGVLGADPADVALVAAHPWDVDGASRAGLRTVWVDRSGSPYPEVFARPDLTVAGLEELAPRLTPLR